MPTCPRRILSIAALLGAASVSPLVQSLGAAPHPAGVPRQVGDDEVPLLQPKVPRSPQNQAQIEAASHYMAGRVLLNRNKLKPAYKQFKLAAEADPGAVAIYYDLVPLAFQLEENAEAIQFATKAVELDPENVELLQQLATSLAGQQRVAEAVQYLEQAARSPSLNKKSPEFVLLARNLGILYLVIGEKEKAADHYASLLEALKNPTDFGLDLRTRSALANDRRTSLETIGQVLLDAGKAEGAGEAFELAKKAGKISPGNYTYFRSRVLLLSDKAEEALSELQTYFDAQRISKGRDAYELLSEILKKLNRSDELLGRLETLAKDDPRNNTLQYFLAEHLAAAGELERARGIYEEALKDTTDTAGAMGLAKVLQKLGLYRELLDVLEKAVSKAGPESLAKLGAELDDLAHDEKTVDQLIEVGREQAKAGEGSLSFEKCYLLAKLAAELHKTEAAEEFYRLAVPTARQRLELIYSEWAQMLLNEQKYAQAAKVLQEAIEKPDLGARRPNYLFMLSQALEMAGDTEGALKAIADALRDVPDNPLLLFQEAWIYYHARRFDEAVAKFEKLMETAGENKEILRRCQMSLSNIHVLKGEIRKGEEILEKIYASDPEDAGVNNDLGYLYADQGKNLEQAEKMIRKALATDPENGAYLDSLGWVLFKLGKYEEAAAQLELAIKHSTGTGDGTLWDHLGDCQQQLKQMDKAVESWRKALQQLEAEKYPEANTIERVKQKLKEHGPADATPKPATPGTP